MIDWASKLLCKTDKLWQSSIDLKGDGLTPITLASRNAVGAFCSYVGVEASRWFVAAGDEGSIDVDIDIGCYRYSFVFHHDGSYHWTNYRSGVEVVGGGENTISRVGIDLCFFELPDYLTPPEG